MAGPPAGSGPNANNFSRSQQAFDNGAVTTTKDSVFLGFGLEGLAPAARDRLREAVVQAPRRPLAR